MIIYLWSKQLFSINSSKVVEKRLRFSRKLTARPQGKAWTDFCTDKWRCQLIWRSDEAVVGEQINGRIDRQINAILQFYFRRFTTRTLQSLLLRDNNNNISNRLMQKPPTLIIAHHSNNLTHLCYSPGYSLI